MNQFYYFQITSVVHIFTTLYVLCLIYLWTCMVPLNPNFPNWNITSTCKCKLQYKQNWLHILLLRLSSCWHCKKKLALYTVLPEQFHFFSSWQNISSLLTLDVTIIKETNTDLTLLQFNYIHNFTVSFSLSTPHFTYIFIYQSNPLP